MGMKFIVTLSLIVTYAFQTNAQSVCTKLGNFYQAACPNGVDLSSIATGQGRPGKRGPIGEKGERGLKGNEGRKGEPGQTQYDRLEEMISNRINEGEIDARFHCEH